MFPWERWLRGAHSTSRVTVQDVTTGNNENQPYLQGESEAPLHSPSRYPKASSLESCPWFNLSLFPLESHHEFSRNPSGCKFSAFSEFGARDSV